MKQARGFCMLVHHSWHAYGAPCVGSTGSPKVVWRGMRAPPWISAKLCATSRAARSLAMPSPALGMVYHSVMFAFGLYCSTAFSIRPTRFVASANRVRQPFAQAAFQCRRSSGMISWAGLGGGSLLCRCCSPLERGGGALTLCCGAFVLGLSEQGCASSATL